MVSLNGINPAHITSPCRWYPEPGCHQQGVCQGQRKSAHTGKPASSQTALLGSLCGSLVGSTRTREGRSKCWCLASETWGCLFLTRSPWGESLIGWGGLGCHLVCIGSSGSRSSGAQSIPQPLRGHRSILPFHPTATPSIGH